MQITSNLQHALAELCLVENSDQLLIKYPSSTEEEWWPTEIADYLSWKSVVVLDETKPLMRICDRWRQEGTTDRRGRSHPPQCITSREDRQIVRMAVTDRSVTSRTVAQHIEFVTHHSVSARTIQRHLQQSGLSARRPLLGLPLRRTTDVSAANGAMKEGCGCQNGMKLSLLTSHVSMCNTTTVGF
ncbi:HTH_38 domain-containing protein [Trichonephila clavipes]|nr:HTH_38 domain-containing protein [Trichonephila clavipes]